VLYERLCLFVGKILQTFLHVFISICSFLAFFKFPTLLYFYLLSYHYCTGGIL
jgi:hypothetical protein